MTILIVDDDVDSLNFCRMLLAPFEREVFLKRVQSILEIRKREPQGGGMSRSATDDEIVVEVAADLREIVPTFLENRRKDIRVIGEAIERGDLGAIRVIGHRLQGTGGGYGFPRLAEIGDSLEKGAEAGDTGALRALLAEMAEFVAKVRVVYRERDP